MKLLLLTDMPPCKNHDRGLVLHELCSFLPEDSVACFTVLERDLAQTIDPALEGIPYRWFAKPPERQPRRCPGRLGALECFLAESYLEAFVVKGLSRLAADFAKEFGAQAIWCVLQGQTMVRMAVDVHKLTGLPLLTQVFDLPEWWLKDNALDGWSYRLLLKTFGKALKYSHACATASWAMAETFKAQYHIDTFPLIPSIDASWAMPPAKSIHDRDSLVIGIAGRISSQIEWASLISALDEINWTIGGKKIVIRLLGRLIETYSKNPQHIEYLGWHNRKDTIKLLSEADILYCAYWFDPAFKAKTHQSFSSRITTYLAAGRPILFHGPAWASAGLFLKEHNAALCLDDLSPSAVRESLSRLVADDELYQQLAANGLEVFKNHLTLQTMKSQFFGFLGIDRTMSKEQATLKQSHANIVGVPIVSSRK